MSVRQSLLAILDQGPCYGYQLRAEYARRTGASRVLNVGQVYNTLERLARDGEVVEDETDEHGHVFWRITDAGRGTVRKWLTTPVAREDTARDELALKVALAATLPGTDALAVVRVERDACAAELRSLRAERRRAEPDLAASIVRDARILSARSRMQWLDGVARRLDEHPAPALALRADPPRRGRPARAAG